MTSQFTVLIEEDFASNNFTLYIPDLRLSAIGDTEEEVIENAKEIIQTAYEDSPELKCFKTKVATLTIDISSKILRV